MVGSIHIVKRRRFYWALGFSLGFHLMLLFLFTRWGNLTLFPVSFVNDNKAPERRIAFELVETPEESRSDIPPAETNLVSDKNALAGDLNPRVMTDQNLPYSPGIIDVKDIAMRASERSYGEAAQRNRRESSPVIRDNNAAYRTARSNPEFFSKESLFESGSQAESSRPLIYKQETSSASLSRGISFNTYAWDFAPYLLELQRRIQRNIFPPAAFTRLGFGGVNVIRFRIYPDGRFAGSEILGFEGEKALVETSKKAVELSAPFQPLPDNFPEDFLEVTARFDYIIQKQ